MDNNNHDVSSIVASAVENHGREHDAFIPILLEVNKALGYIPGEALTEIRRHVHVPENRVFVSEGRLYSLASFYHMLSTEARGRHIVVFCESAPCHVVGGREVWNALQEQLGIKAGETSADGKWSLITTSCLGACGVGPVVVIDDEMFANVTPATLTDILAKFD